MYLTSIWECQFHEECKKLINNYKYLYNLSYATNFSILLGIGVAGFFLAKNYFLI